MFNRIASALGYERKSLASPDAWLREMFGSVQTITGADVTPSSALRVPAVACAVRAISEAAACLDVKIMRREGATETEVPDHPVAALMRDCPNDWTSGFEFVRDILVHALLHDAGGIGWVNRVGDGVREVILYDPGKITVQRATDGTGQFSYLTDGRELPVRDVIHLRSPFGQSPVSLARESIALALTLEGHAGKLFKDTRPSALVSFKDRMSPKEMSNAVKALQAMFTSPTTGGTLVMDNEAKYSSMVLSSVDAQYIEITGFQILQIARAFRVPPQMLFDLERATWSNSEQMGREFLTYTLEPWLRALEGALRRALFTEDEYATHRIIFERDDLTRADLGQRATAYSSLIAARVMNPNEARGWEGLPAYEGGDEFANPHTSTATPAAAAGEGISTVDTPGAAAPQPEAR